MALALCSPSALWVTVKWQFAVIVAIQDIKLNKVIQKLIYINWDGQFKNNIVVLQCMHINEVTEFVYVFAKYSEG